jgi:cysteinyl-tRNA synthetase
MILYDTLSAQKKIFQPNGNDNKVKIYVCGVTPYSETHIGHALSYVMFDVLRRYLEYQGYEVQHIENFTDVDDKIIARANTEGISIEELSSRYIEDYFKTMDALNIKRADYYPRATLEIPKIIEIISTLIDKGYAYATDGDVNFRVAKDPEYGKLSHRTLESMIDWANSALTEKKDHPLDFALWKSSKPDEPSWDSPWGPGRPGWHIECTAMAIRYLGETIDIHGGGQDLIFPHHENEIAQSEGYTGVKPFVGTWMHNGLLHLGEDKMSKSLGNLITVKEALTKHSPDSLRLLFLSSHYRSPLTYSEPLVVSSERARQRLLNALRPNQNQSHSELDGLRTPLGVDVSTYQDRFEEEFIAALEDDLNTPQALATLFDLAREINRQKGMDIEVSGAQKCLRKLGSILGLTLDTTETVNANDSSDFIALLIDIRTQLRAERHWELADKIRDQLEALGISLEDSASGTQWQIKD